MLHAVFYARFHPRRGPSVVHQFPPNAIVASDPDAVTLPISFSDVSSYVIPPYELCNRPLSVCAGGYRILGYPISLEDAKYDRNRFTFNICFVLREEDDERPWHQLVRKTAAFLTEMEEQSEVLQDEEELEGLRLADAVDYPAHGIGKLHTLLQRILRDLNEYGETCTRVDATYVINLRLFPCRPEPPKVNSWDVPLLIRSLPKPGEWTWDLTLLRVHTHIDGVNHVQRIAALADVELRLVKRAVRELVYHERAILLDLFHFQAIYTLASPFSHFVASTEAQDECRNYVHLDPTANPLNKSNTSRPSSAAGKSVSDAVGASLPSRDAIVGLYTALSPGVQVQDYVLAHHTELANVDVRRLITFGVIKGFLRRVHKYVMATDPASHDRDDSERVDSQSPTKRRVRIARDDDVARELDRAWKKAALSSGWATPPSEPTAPSSSSGTPTQYGSLSRSAKSAAEARSREDERLRPYLDGTTRMDQIAVELGMSERKIVERLRGGKFDEVVMFCR